VFSELSDTRRLSRRSRAGAVSGEGGPLLWRKTCRCADGMKGIGRSFSSSQTSTPRTVSSATWSQVRAGPSRNAISLSRSASITGLVHPW